MGRGRILPTQKSLRTALEKNMRPECAFRVLVEHRDPKFLVPNLERQRHDRPPLVQEKAATERENTCDTNWKSLNLIFWKSPKTSFTLSLLGVDVWRRWAVGR